EPLGPTMTDTPGANSSTVRSAKDLNPRRVRDRRNTSSRMLPTAADGIRSFGPRLRFEARRPRSLGAASVDDGEPALPDGRLLGRLQVGHVGPARSPAAPLDHGVDLLVGSFEDSLDPVVGEVPDGAAHAAAAGLLAAGPSVADGLDPAGHNDPD